MPDKSTTELTEYKLNQMHVDIKSILSQAIKTNSRVRALELWRSFVLGVAAVMVLWGAWFVSDINDRMKSFIVEEISKIEIEVIN